MASAATHTQVTAVGVLPSGGGQLETLTRILSSQSQTQRGAELLRQTEHVLIRSDQKERLTIERADPMWAPVVRARASNLKVLLEGGRCQLALPLLPLPARGKQAATIRPIVFNELFLSGDSIEQNESHDHEWREIVHGLGWEPNFTLKREGLRFQLIGGSSATSAQKPPEYLALEVLVCAMDSLKSGGPSKSKVTAYLVQIVATVPSEEVWKAALQQNASGDSESAAEVAVKEVEKLCEALKSVIEFTRDAET